MKTEEQIDHVNTTNKASVYHSPIQTIFEKFSRQKDASFVYGEPIEMDNKRVLPVAKVQYSVGGGGGFSDKTEKTPTAQGEGGGGHFAIKPVGVFEITAEKVKFKPVIHLNFVLGICAICTLGLALIWKKSSK